MSHPRIGSDHQRVHLVSVYHNTHLFATDQKDPDRRHVITGKPYGPFDSLDYGRLKEWRLVPSREGNNYEIMHHHYNEPLCATPDELAFDKDRRTVLTWIPGPTSLHSLWEIKHASEGHYLIRSVEFGEYLYAADYPSKDKVWTWRKLHDPLNKQFHWDIINV